MPVFLPIDVEVLHNRAGINRFSHRTVDVSRRDLKIDHRVADAAVAEPLLDHLYRYAGICQMGAERVFKNMRMTLLYRYACRQSMTAKHPIQLESTEFVTVVVNEESSTACFGSSFEPFPKRADLVDR